MEGSRDDVSGKRFREGALREEMVPGSEADNAADAAGQGPVRVPGCATRALGWRSEMVSAPRPLASAPRPLASTSRPLASASRPLASTAPDAALAIRRTRAVAADSSLPALPSAREAPDRASSPGRGRTPGDGASPPHGKPAYPDVALALGRLRAAPGLGSEARVASRGGSSRATGNPAGTPRQANQAPSPCTSGGLAPAYARTLRP